MENRCAHRAAEFCRELTGNTKEFVCPSHQWTYELTGALARNPLPPKASPAKAACQPDFDMAAHGLTRLHVTTHRGVVFAHLRRRRRNRWPTISAPKDPARVRGNIRRPPPDYPRPLPPLATGKLEAAARNLKDPYHATLLHTFLVTFGLLVAGNKSLMLTDATGRHGVMASAKSDAKVAADVRGEMRAYKEGMTLAEPRFMDFIDEFDSPWSVTMATIWPNLIVQREIEHTRHPPDRADRPARVHHEMDHRCSASRATMTQ